MCTSSSEMLRNDIGMSVTTCRPYVCIKKEEQVKHTSLQNVRQSATVCNVHKQQFAMYTNVAVVAVLYFFCESSLF